MLRLKLLLATVGLAVSISPAANATLIVDTGPGLGDYNVGLAEIQSLAGQFTTTQPWLINSVEGWLQSRSGDVSTATVSIYSDAGALPGLELYSTAFNIAANSGTNWQGGFALDWLLHAGTYWAVFEIRPGQTFDGAMPGPAGLPLPLAYSLSLNNYEWLPGDSSIGIRIDAADASVASAGTLALLGLALFALRGRRSSNPSG